MEMYGNRILHGGVVPGLEMISYYYIKEVCHIIFLEEAQYIIDFLRLNLGYR